MTCVVCRQGETQPGETTVTFAAGQRVVVIHRTPAEVCENCGEPYISEATTDRLLQLAADSRRLGTTLLVRDFAGA